MKKNSAIEESIDTGHTPNFQLLPKEKEAIWRTPEIVAEMKAEVTERKACIVKGFTAEQIDAHIQLWRQEHQPIISKRLMNTNSK